MSRDGVLVRRLVSRVDTHNAERLARRASHETAEARLGLTYQPGDRVVDTVTGQEGVIHAGQQALDLVPTARPAVD